MHNFIESIENDEIKYLEFKLCFWGMGKVLEAKEELGKPILWGMGWVNRRLGILAATHFKVNLYNPQFY